MKTQLWHIFACVHNVCLRLMSMAHLIQGLARSCTGYLGKWKIYLYDFSAHLAMCKGKWQETSGRRSLFARLLVHLFYLQVLEEVLVSKADPLLKKHKFTGAGCQQHSQVQNLSIVDILGVSLGWLWLVVVMFVWSPDQRKKDPLKQGIVS